MPINTTANSAEDYVVADEFDVDARPVTSTGAVQSGWGDAVTPKGDFATEFKFNDKVQVVRFIDSNDGHPLASYKTHFLDGKAKGRKSYVCLGNNCPLCALDPSVKGQKADNKCAFSIINFSVEPFERQLLIASPRLYKTLHVYAHGDSGPLNSKFWGLSRTGERQTTMYHITPIKSRDLEEDWGINEAAAQAMLASSEPFDKSVIRETAYAELVDIAAELS
jgi:hypothetical protein